MHVKSMCACVARATTRLDRASVRNLNGMTTVLDVSSASSAEQSPSLSDGQAQVAPE